MALHSPLNPRFHPAVVSESKAPNFAVLSGGPQLGDFHPLALIAPAFLRFAPTGFHALPVHYQVSQPAFFVLGNHHRTGLAGKRQRGYFAPINSNTAAFVGRPGPARRLRRGIIRAILLDGDFPAFLHGLSCRGRNRWGCRSRTARIGGGWGSGAHTGVGHTAGFSRPRLPIKGRRFGRLPGRLGQRTGQGHAAAQQPQTTQHQRPGQEAFGQRGRGRAALHQAAHPAQQGPAPAQGGQRQPGRGGRHHGALAPLGQGREGAGQPQRVAVHERDGRVVTAIFALAAHAAGHKPHRRMVKEHRLGHHLQQVHEVVAAQHVGQLMGQNGFQMRRRQARHRAQRQQNHGPHVAHHQRHPHQRRLQQRHRPAQAGAGRQPRQPRLPHRRQRLHPVAPQALHVQQAAQQPQAHGQQTQQPGHHQHRQLIIEVAQTSLQGPRECRGYGVCIPRCGGHNHRRRADSRWGGFVPACWLPGRRRPSRRGRTGRYFCRAGYYLPHACRAGLRRSSGVRSRRKIQAERDAGQGHHRAQRPSRGRVAHLGALPAQQQQGPGQHGRYQCALPQRVQQGPT